jgi:pyruvate formate lyase activating enzyme
MCNSTVSESPLYEKIADRVKCGLCERRCVISPGKRGLCGARENISGKLYTLVYGDISAMESRPIEIKPFFHFHPGSTALTFSTWGCNFRCPWCQNWHLSRRKPEPAAVDYIPPEKMVETALAHGDSGLCASFQEPTLLFEYALDAFAIGKEKGLYNCYVSNGYLTLEALTMLHNAGMDAINIDIKGDDEVYSKYCKGTDVNVVWRNAAEAKKLGMHVEMINLVITGVNDDKECLNWIIEKHLESVGPETPLHFTRYHPAYKFTNPSTKIETLEEAYVMAKEAGVLYPYLGNVPGHRYENTYCPSCGRLLVERMSYTMVKYEITPENRCPDCGGRILMVGFNGRARPQPMHFRSWEI